MKYVDYVEITCVSGKGGNGVIGFSHFPNNYYGGPCGGNGGKGGNIYVQGSSNSHSLLDIKFKKFYKAEDGKDGGINNRQGRSGKDLCLLLPLGSLVINKDTNEVVCDVIKDGEKILIVSGGNGGHGNNFFKTESHRAPYLCENGEKGTTINLKIELKTLADVALIGFPNAGKSTLFKTITNTNVKVAPYKFTTLVPNISYKYINDRKIFFVDIPGIIKDAHLGKGLGFTFLRHAERTNYIILLLDGDLEPEDIIKQYEEITNELDLFSKRLKEIERAIVVSKVDNITFSKSKMIKKLFQNLSHPVDIFFVSGLKKINIETLYQIIFNKIKDLNIFHWESNAKVLINVDSYFDKIDVKKVNSHFWMLTSKRLDYWVERIPYKLSNENWKRLEKKILNIIKRSELTERYKFQKNDIIQVKDFQFKYYEETI